MPRLPSHEHAEIPLEKMRYCLDSSHPVGQHKARVFASALGLGFDDVPVLERMLRDGIASHDGALLFTYSDGTERWVIEWVVLGRLGPMRLISVWNVPRRSRRPRLVTCYMKRVRE